MLSPSLVPNVWSSWGPGYFEGLTPLFQPQAKPRRWGSEELLQPQVSNSKSQEPAKE